MSWLVLSSVIFCCYFSYHALLELQYQDKWQKSLATKERVKKEGLSIQEAEHCLDTELFLDKYPWWDVRGLHCLFILQRMFVHAAESGQKEAERLICCGCWCDLPRLNPRADAISHPDCGIPDLPRRNWGALPSGVYVEETAWAPTMWAQMSAGGNQGHL